MASLFDSSKNKNNDDKLIFPGDSQMAEFMNTYDWKSHPLGAPENWPFSLKTGLRIILHSAHPMFIWWSQDLFMFHNDGYVPLIGNKHPKALGSKAKEVWAEIWPQLGSIVEGIMKGEKAFFGEELLVPINRKGFIEEAYFTFSYSAMFDDEGKVNGIFCACHEVTETVHSKRRLKVIKDLGDSLSGVSNVKQACQTACELLAGDSKDSPFSLIYLLDKSGDEVNLQGYSSDDFKEITPERFNISEVENSLLWPFSKVKESRQPEVINLGQHEDLFNSSGSVSLKQAVVLPVLQPENNQLLGFLISGINASLEYDQNYQSFHELLAAQIGSSIANIKSRADVENQKARLERFFMQAPAAICILDGPDLVFELVNPGYQKLFPGRELLGKPVLKALPEIEDNAVYRTFLEVYETGKTHEEQEMHIPIARTDNASLEDRYFKYIQQARYDESGKIDGVLVFGYEVTELVLSRRKAEASEKELQSASDELAAINEELAAANEEILASNEELSNTNQQLLRINSDLDNFIYTASHDLKAPILNIEGLLQALLRSLPLEMQSSERIQKIAGMMQSSVDRFKKTINNLTEITKLQKENNQEASLINISEVIEEVTLDLEPMIKSLQAQVETSMQVCSPIRFSHKNLRSIVYNLLSNALKYRSPGRIPKVQISCRQTDEYLILKIQDNGLGMNLTDDSKIFAMFKRLHSHVEGDGIGLYMVKKIMDNAGGKIEVESKVGEGSAFQVYFIR